MLGYGLKLEMNKVRWGGGFGVGLGRRFTWRTTCIWCSSLEQTELRAVLD